MAESEEGMADNVVQVIDGEAEFRREFSGVMEERWGMKELGFDYNVVAVLGCQSSGKSTLLNLMFGTNFQVMDDTMGRSQTTLGIWLGKARDGPTLVFDVEGTDSRERGEENMNFERKTSLFSLALAEVVIVNLWAQDIGRYNAANYALLKTVFELNLQLFAGSGKSKTLLMFCIRDHVSSPLATLKGTIVKDMATIWEGLIKPDQFQNSAVSDFFDFSFTSLPHKVLEPERFTTEVERLKSWFFNKDVPEYVWTGEYSTDVPSDGFPAYAEGIWDVIKSNKDLDLPTQKEMLATYRCEEISEECFQEFKTGFVALRSEIDESPEQPIDSFGARASALLEAALVRYEGPSSLYHRETALKKREVLRNRVLHELCVLFESQLARLLTCGVRQFTSDLKSIFGADASDTKTNEAMTVSGVKSRRSGATVPAAKATTEVSVNAPTSFARASHELTEAALSAFRATAATYVVEGAEDLWEHSVTEAISRMTKAVQEVVAVERARQLKYLVKEIIGGLEKRLLAPLVELLESGNTDPSDVWSRVRELYGGAREEAVAVMESRLDGFEAADGERVSLVDGLRVSIFDAVKERVKDKSRYLTYRMEKIFDDAFRLDDNGLPRRWQPSDDVAGLFTRARDAAIRLIDVYAVIRCETDSLDGVSFLKADGATGIAAGTGGESTEMQAIVDPDYIVLTPDDCQQTRDRFKRDCESAYMQAVRDQETAGATGSIPAFMILLLIVVGFNEFMAIISNPLYLFVTVLCGGAFYVINVLNLFPVIRPVMNTVVQQVVGRVQAAVNPAAGTAPAAARPHQD
eukprot:TRINITY_DN3703_c1_g2_i1.p1 TRINITY_DN3703_c1_g2~~TRINITY_DN3703_c1_g2_i1.p1  ORF type:complete len:806 (+),score=215.04 TRINITY_DN3703_c1_g2_i1:97-2514(+)